MHGTDKIIQAEEFPNRCLALLEELAQTGESVLVMRSGKLVAKMVPVAMEHAPPAATAPKAVQFGALRGSVRWHGDPLAPTGEPWHAQEGELLRDES